MEDFKITEQYQTIYDLLCIPQTEIYIKFKDINSSEELYCLIINHYNNGMQQLTPFFNVFDKLEQYCFEHKKEIINVA